MTKTNWPFIPAEMLEISAADGVHLVTSDGQRILDAAGGAIVTMWSLWRYCVTGDQEKWSFGRPVSPGRGDMRQGEGPAQPVQYRSQLGRLACHLPYHMGA